MSGQVVCVAQTCHSLRTGGSRCGVCVVVQEGGRQRHGRVRKGEVVVLLCAVPVP